MNNVQAIVITDLENSLLQLFPSKGHACYYTAVSPLSVYMLQLRAGLECLYLLKVHDCGLQIDLEEAGRMIRSMHS